MQTERAKSSHFDRTRGLKNQIFPTLESLESPGYCPWRTLGEPMVSLYNYFVFWTDLFSDMALSCWKLHVNVYVVASQERLAIFSLRLRCQLGSNKKVQLRAGRAFLRSEFACRGRLIWEFLLGRLKIVTIWWRWRYKGLFRNDDCRTKKGSCRSKNFSWQNNDVNQSQRFLTNESFGFSSIFCQMKSFYPRDPFLVLELSFIKRGSQLAFKAI